MLIASFRCRFEDTVEDRVTQGFEFREVPQCGGRRAYAVPAEVKLSNPVSLAVPQTPRIRAPRSQAHAESADPESQRLGA